MQPIGFLDSGIGGLTILDAIHKKLPAYDTLYFGDSAHAPYGNKSPNELYELVSKGTQWLFAQNCSLVIYVCNTASAVVLRKIQTELLLQYPNKKVLGIIRPTVEELARKKYKHVLILSTPATAKSKAYEMELKKLYPDSIVTAHACPNWGPLVETGKAQSVEAENDVAHEFSNVHNTTTAYDAILLACTHYPYLTQWIEKYKTPQSTLYHQGDLIAQSLSDYLMRHVEIEKHLTKNVEYKYVVTGDADLATRIANDYFGYPVLFENVLI